MLKWLLSTIGNQEFHENLVSFFTNTSYFYSQKSRVLYAQKRLQIFFFAVPLESDYARLSRHASIKSPNEAEWEYVKLSALFQIKTNERTRSD